MKKITISLPDRLSDALTEAGRPFDQGPADFLKFVVQAASLPTGIHFKLELPPLDADAAQPELPLQG